MKQGTIKRVALYVGFLLIAFLPRALWAESASQSTANQPGQSNDLSWPMARVLEPSLKWDRKLGSFQDALGIGSLDPQHPAATNYTHGIDLLGEWFVTVISTGSMSANYGTILKEAGYSESVTIPEKHVILGFYDPQGREERTANNELPYWLIGGFIKRAGSNIRLVVVLLEPYYAGGLEIPSRAQISVFASKITPLGQILKNQK